MAITFPLPAFLTLLQLSVSYPTLEADHNSVDYGAIPASELAEIQVRLWNYVRSEVDEDSSQSLDKFELRKWFDSSQQYLKRKQVQLHFDDYIKEKRGEVEVILKEVLLREDEVLEALNEKRFSEADRNGDGALTLLEFESFLFPSDHVLAREFIDWLTSRSENTTQVSLTGPFQHLIQRLNVKVS